MPKLANPAKQAIRERSVYTVTVRDEQGSPVHQFTTLANHAEVLDIVTNWFKPLLDAGLGQGYTWSRETKVKRTN